ncbi:MAG: Asp23/Gls24 family envelope stress response protein [Candidatus Caldatribacteriota bacterium]|nr:Asp23/Gls24 family envelope stress response protein [Candidatus Caldatribacteriota bacterium]
MIKEKSKEEGKEKKRLVNISRKSKKASILARKRENIEEKKSLGEVNIVSEVIATIISRTVITIEGVVGLASHSKGGIGTLLGIKELEKGIKVDLKENKEIYTTISVIVEYGSIIIEVAKKIQKKVKEELETKTGLTVSEINVNIQGVNIREKNKSNG